MRMIRQTLATPAILLFALLWSWSALAAENEVVATNEDGVQIKSDKFVGFGSDSQSQPISNGTEDRIDKSIAEQQIDQPRSGGGIEFGTTTTTVVDEFTVVTTGQPDLVTQTISAIGLSGTTSEFEAITVASGTPPITTTSNDSDVDGTSDGTSVSPTAAAGVQHTVTTHIDTTQSSP